MADAGTVTITEQDWDTMKKIKFAWTSGTGGDANKADKQTTYAYSGEIRRLVTVPATGGSAPADNYSVALNDEDGVDVLMGAGAARDTANTEQVLASSLGVCAGSKLYLHVTAAGDTKSGIAIVYIR